jgi:26S proteasome non-ATPase regulatory subunit 10
VCFAEIGAAMETMVGAGAPASARGIDNDALFEAAESGKDGVFEDLSPEQLTKARTLRNEDDRSLLHVAASSGHTQVFFFPFHSSSLLK